MDNKLKPARKKPTFAPSTGNIFGNSRLDVPECYLKEAASKELECRWVSAKELKENHGSHKRLWRAYKFESKPTDGILEKERFAYGEDPEGIVRRGDLVLAVRPIELGDQHREMLRDKRKIYNRFAQVKEKELRDYVKQESRGMMKVDGPDDDK